MDIDPTSSPPPARSAGVRTARRILVETVVVALVGACVWGFLWEVGQPHYGLIVAIVIWIAGAPLLELARAMRVK